MEESLLQEHLMQNEAFFTNNYFLLEILKSDHRFEQHSEVVTIKDRGTFITTGKADDDFYIIQDGIVCVRGKNSIIIQFIKSGSSFGYSNLFNTDQMNLQYEILTPATLLKIDKDFMSAIFRNNRLGIYILDEYYTKTIQLVGLRLESFELPSDRRVAVCLYEIAKMIGQKTNQGTLIPRVITQQHVAEYCQTSREYTTMILNRLAKDGYIRLRPKPWFIPDVEALVHRL